MKQHILFTLGIAALAMYGCGQFAAQPLQQPVATSNDDVTAQVRAKVIGDRQLQALVAPYDINSINHIDVELWDSTISTKYGTKTLSTNPFSTVLNFSHLHKNSTYKVVAKAYSDAGGTIKISADVNSTVTLATTMDNSATPVAVPVQLIDKTFDGAATGAVTVTGGTVVDTASAPAIN